MTFMLILGLLSLAALIALPFVPYFRSPPKDAVDETQAEYDALMVIDDEVAKNDARAKAHEAALRAADAAVMAKYGRRESSEL